TISPCFPTCASFIAAWPHAYRRSINSFGPSVGSVRFFPSPNTLPVSRSTTAASTFVPPKSIPSAYWPAMRTPPDSQDRPPPRRGRPPPAPHTIRQAALADSPFLLGSLPTHGVLHSPDAEVGPNPYHGTRQSGRRTTG